MQRTKALDQIVSKVKYAKHLKNEQQSLSNSSSKLKKKKHFLSLSTEASIIFTWNPDNDNVEKRYDNQVYRMGDGWKSWALWENEIS